MYSHAPALEKLVQRRIGILHELECAEHDYVRCFEPVPSDPSLSLDRATTSTRNQSVWSSLTSALRGNCRTKTDPLLARYVAPLQTYTLRRFGGPKAAANESSLEDVLQRRIIGTRFVEVGLSASEPQDGASRTERTRFRLGNRVRMSHAGTFEVVSSPRQKSSSDDSLDHARAHSAAEQFEAYASSPPPMDLQQLMGLSFADPAIPSLVDWSMSSSKDDLHISDMKESHQAMHTVLPILPLEKASSILPAVNGRTSRLFSSLPTAEAPSRSTRRLQDVFPSTRTTSKPEMLQLQPKDKDVIRRPSSREFGQLRHSRSIKALSRQSRSSSYAIPPIPPETFQAAIRPIASISPTRIIKLYDSIRKARSALKVINEEVLHLQNEAYQCRESGTALQGWMLIGSNLRYLPGVQIIEGNTKADLRWERVGDHRSNRHRLVCFWLGSLGIILLTCAICEFDLRARCFSSFPPSNHSHHITVVPACAVLLADTPRLLAHVSFLRPLVQANGLLRGLSLRVVPAFFVIIVLACGCSALRCRY